MRLPIYPLSHCTTPSRFALWRGTMLGDVILKLCKMNREEYVKNKVNARLRELVFDTDECIEFPTLNKGYGVMQITVNGKKTHNLMHRKSYELFVGEIEKGLIICHKCDNPKCVNPKHLFKGTHNDNVQDKVAKGRQAKGKNNGRYIDGRCSDNIIKKTHTHGRKFTDEQVIKIKSMLKSGIMPKQISENMGVSHCSVRDIACGRTYKYLDKIIS